MYHLFLGPLRFHLKPFYNCSFSFANGLTDKRRLSLIFLGRGRHTDCAWPCSWACAHACGLGLEPAWSRAAIGCGRAWLFGVAVDSPRPGISRTHWLAGPPLPPPPRSAHQVPQPRFFFNRCSTVDFNSSTPSVYQTCARACVLSFGASATWRTTTNRTSRLCRRSRTSPPASGSTPSRRQPQRAAGKTGAEGSPMAQRNSGALKGEAWLWHLL